jgi:hypothetical protein
MDFLHSVISRQNHILLTMIANEKFQTDEDKTEFIHKYKKINYQKIIQTKESNIDHYRNILSTFELEHNNSNIHCEHNH